MARELTEIEDDRAALLFAAGCLRATAGLAFGAHLRSARAAVRAALFPPFPSTRSLAIMNRLSAQPRFLGLVCGAAAVGMGMAYMLAAGAPSRYLMVNFAALVLGATAWLALGGAGRSRLAGAGAATFVMAAGLLLTAFFGAAADGASRWVIVGPLSVQVSLIVLPVMMILYARRPDPIGTAGMIVAALALALQPDRAMAGVLAAGLVALLVARPGRLPALAAAASVLAFGRTLLIPDLLPASPYVDGVFYTAFAAHPLAGVAVVTGAAALLVPAGLGLARGGGDRPALLAFGVCWSAVVAAAALDNYPTPLVGYGGSAVLGYLLSVSLLPGAPREAGSGRAAVTTPAADQGPDRTLADLRAARPA
jgi:cell division protein FtsW (lipid II flippase)